MLPNSEVLAVSTLNFALMYINIKIQHESSVATLLLMTTLQVLQQIKGIVAATLAHICSKRHTKADFFWFASLEEKGLRGLNPLSFSTRVSILILKFLGHNPLEIVKTHSYFLS